jgi:hypothetical protein
LSFTPVGNASGNATITVTVNDGQALNNLISQTFTVTVIAPATNSTVPAIGLPTLDPISDLFLTKNSGAQTVTVRLTGITVGANTSVKKPKLKITASSSNGAMIKQAKIKYKSPSTTGTLTLKLQKAASGTAIITLTANNGKNQVKQSFTVTVQDPGAAPLVNMTSNVEQVAATTTPTGSILTPTTPVDGQFAFSLAGVPDGQYVIEASADLANWVPVTTNTAPFNFVDGDSGKFKQRFYRAVSASAP